MTLSAVAVQQLMQQHPILGAYATAKGPAVLNLAPLSFLPNGCVRCQGCYCPIWTIARDHPEFAHVMPVDILAGILDDVTAFPVTPVLRLLPHGELTCYPHLADSAALLRPLASRVPIVANTNGVDLPALEPLLPSLAVLEVSAIAADDRAYRDLRLGARPGDFDRITTQLLALAARVVSGELKLRLVVSYLAYPGLNDHGWPRFRDFWAAAGAEPVRRDYHSFSNHVPPPPSRPANGRPLPPCKSLFTRMTVTSRGEFVRCYNDVLATDVIGRLGPDDRLADLWFSPANYQGMLVMLGEAPGTIFCSGCRDRVCADPRAGVGTGQPLEVHARSHHRRVFPLPSCN